MKTVDFYFDFGSPAAYLAWTQLPALCAQADARLNCRPMLLGGVFKATGNHSPAQIPTKSTYIRQDFARFADRYGVPLNYNPHFPVNTLQLMRGAVAMQDLDEGAHFDAYCRAIFEAMWVSGQNLGEAAVVGAVLNEAGFDAEALLARITDAQVKQRLIALTEDAVARGVFGAPTFFVGEAMFWGQDRLDFVREALAVG